MQRAFERGRKHGRDEAVQLMTTAHAVKMARMKEAHCLSAMPRLEQHMRNEPCVQRPAAVVPVPATVAPTNAENLLIEEID